MEERSKNKRFDKLRILHEELVSKERFRNESLKKENWLLEQVQELKKIAECENCTLDIVKLKINEIVFEFEDGERK
jgi:hypothetical protein